MAELMDYLTQAVERRASDLFFVAGGSASAKVEGQILPLDGERLLPPKTGAGPVPGERLSPAGVHGRGGAGGGL